MWAGEILATENSLNVFQWSPTSEALREHIKKADPILPGLESKVWLVPLDRFGPEKPQNLVKILILLKH